MERVCIYLRKSRADLEAEARGEGETLAKHKKALLKVAKTQGLNIIKIHEEIVSGESLFHRPKMQELLREVTDGSYDAVLCMDVDRLGRGDMEEQGLIQKVFQTSKTKIVTTRKTYDLSDEWDEEYSEFEMFMARKELKLINRRLQGGRVRSVEEGNYIGTRPPYGYEIHNSQTGRTLVPHPEQKELVRMIFEWYTDNDPKTRLGSNKIANRLNDMGKKSYTGIEWTPPSVLVILKNAVYTGRIQWKKKETKKSREEGKRRDTKTRPVEEWIDVKGKHEPLISQEQYDKAQVILSGKYHVPYHLENGITNPLAGLIRCGKCGSSMVLRPYGKQQPHIMCYNKFCENKSSRFEYVERELMDAIEQWLEQYKTQWGLRKKRVETGTEQRLKESAILALQRELMELETQKSRLHDLLEQGIYSVETYLERSKSLAERIEETKQKIETVAKLLQDEKKTTNVQKEINPSKIESVIKLYQRSKDPAAQNNLLKSIIKQATYTKEKTQRNDDFTLVLTPLRR